jgi:hypothetical protein
VALNTPTTLVAIRSDTGQRFTIGDLPLDDVRRLSDARLLTCPNCGGALQVKAGSVRLHHFAHVTLSTCADADHEPETDAHRAGKLRLYQQFREGAQAPISAMIERHIPVTDQRADVYIEMSNTAYALEFQQANNSAERWTERHRLYRSVGITDLWFLGQVRYAEQSIAPVSPYDPLPVPRHDFDAASGTFRVRGMEIAMLTIAPHLYYLDPDSGMVTLLLSRGVQHNTLRAYRYRFPLQACELRGGAVWSPLEPRLEDYRRYLAKRG